MTSSIEYHTAIVGGGIVGLATAMALAKRADRSLVVLEAEDRIAAHQTGHNSGVIHSGLYYKPGSLKARLCTEGREALYRFCQEHGIAHERCGKLVVATCDDELERLDELHRRGLENGLKGLARVTGRALQDYEPHVLGVAGLWVPQTGIVDFRAVARAMAEEITKAGRAVRTSARLQRVERTKDHLQLTTTYGPLSCRLLINCGGLQSDRIARLCGLNPKLHIIPFRGEYFEVASTRPDLVRNLIYPVPDPRYPFLGVHLTRTIDGSIHAGPNAVLALKREGYTRASLSFKDVADFAAFGGFWRMARSNWRAGLGEFYRSFSKQAFVRSLQALVPAIDTRDLHRAGTGVRAQAVEPDGRLVDDFRILEANRMIHVLNAPSPAATAAISIGEHIANLAVSRDL